METKTKQAAKTRNEVITTKKDVKAKLTTEAKSATVSGSVIKPKAPQQTKPIKTLVNLDDRIQNFEKLRGLANNREQLVGKLNELTKFNYNHDGSSQFTLRDSTGLEFKTTNTNFIHLVTSQLQSTLEKRKQEIEAQIVQFEL
ncbi:hypothetical protein [Aquimarina algicola]|uniref:Uncharacterized protein n=1 Tax=Aquimarina algicola TaxID=2589995 RepID=A0A504J9F8_9FLAO|nr:hypothetical protein [Aquimarina algicola]TPN84508.1 hypothetical protein FHK87_16380 [Aquimarina algicola]